FARPGAVAGGHCVGERQRGGATHPDAVRQGAGDDCGRDPASDTSDTDTAAAGCGCGPIIIMLIAAPSSALAVERRRVCGREEAREQTGLTALLNEYLDPRDTFWPSRENKPLSPLSGLFQKQRGVRSGLPDIVVIWRGKPIFIELKSRAG